MVYKCPICDVSHWFCKIARFFATEPHGLLIQDMTTRFDLAIVLIIGSIAFVPRDMTMAFITGMIVQMIAILTKAQNLEYIKIDMAGN